MSSSEVMYLVPVSILSCGVLSMALLVSCCILLVRDNYRLNVFSSTRTLNLIMPTNTHSGRHDLMDHSSDTTRKEVSGIRATM